MRGVRVPIGVVYAALALAGCMQTAYPMASAPNSDLDALAYGQPQPSHSYPPSSSPTASAGSGGTPISPGDTILVGERWF